METNMHQTKKNNLDGFNVEVFTLLLSDGSFTVEVTVNLLFRLTYFKLQIISLYFGYHARLPINFC